MIAQAIHEKFADALQFWLDEVYAAFPDHHEAALRIAICRNPLAFDHLAPGLYRARALPKFKKSGRPRGMSRKSREMYAYLMTLESFCIEDVCQAFPQTTEKAVLTFLKRHSFKFELIGTRRFRTVKHVSGGLKKNYQPLILPVDDGFKARLKRWLARYAKGISA